MNQKPENDIVEKIIPQLLVYMQDMWQYVRYDCIMCVAWFLLFVCLLSGWGGG